MMTNGSPSAPALRILAVPVLGLSTTGLRSLPRIGSTPRKMKKHKASNMSSESSTLRMIPIRLHHIKARKMMQESTETSNYKAAAMKVRKSNMRRIYPHKAAPLSTPSPKLQSLQMTPSSLEIFS